MEKEPKTVIDPEFRDFLGKLTPEEYQALEQSLLSEGCRDAIILWPQSDFETAVVLDGHNRMEICERHGIPYHITWVAPDAVGNRQQALAWIAQNQRARRNLTKDQLEYRIGKIFNTEKGEHGGDRKSGERISRGQNDPLICSGSTAERIARQYGVSAPTVKRYGKYAERIDTIASKHGPDAKQEILAGRKRVEDYEPPPAKAPTGKFGILRKRDSNAPPEPINNAEADSDGPADSETASVRVDSFTFTVSELERHTSSLPAVAARENLAMDKRSDLHDRLVHVSGSIIEFAQTLLIG